MMEKRFGKYELLERIGQGGMADVYRARFQGPEGFSKTVALKLMAVSQSDRSENLQMFSQEARLVANLEHSNIVKVYEFEVSEGRYYIAMELVKGEDLATILDECHRSGRLLTVPEALAITLEVCKGLACAHGELEEEDPVILHRDITPHNIMVSRIGEVKITDFGVAKLLSAPHVTKSGIIKGKPSYVSPEHVNGLELDNRSDIFSLGVVLWEMLTGKRLFVGSSDYNTIQNLMQESVKSPSSVRPEVPEELDRVVLSMLERDREERPRTLSDIINDLSPALGRITTEDRTQLVRKMYQEVIGRGPGSRTKEQKLGKADVPDASHGEQAATTPDLPASRGPVPALKRRRLWIWPVAVSVAAVAGMAAYFGATAGNNEEETRHEKTVQADTVQNDAKSPEPSRPAVPASATASTNKENPSGQIAAPLPSSKAPEQDPAGKKEELDDVPLKATKEASVAPVKKTPKRRKKKQGRRKASVGRITVEVVPPGVKVFVDEKYLGRAPLREIAIPVGRHSMTLVDSSGNRKHQWINVREGKTSSFVVMMDRL